MCLGCWLAAVADTTYYLHLPNYLRLTILRHGLRTALVVIKPEYRRYTDSR